MDDKIPSCPAADEFEEPLDDEELVDVEVEVELELDDFELDEDVISDLAN
jgi:hypothetical protein